MSTKEFTAVPNHPASSPADLKSSEAETEIEKDLVPEKPALVTRNSPPVDENNEMDGKFESAREWSARIVSLDEGEYFIF